MQPQPVCENALSDGVECAEVFPFGATSSGFTCAPKRCNKRSIPPRFERPYVNSVGEMAAVEQERKAEALWKHHGRDAAGVSAQMIVVLRCTLAEEILKLSWF